MRRVISQKVLVAALSGIGLLCVSVPSIAADTTSRSGAAGHTRKLTAHDADIAKLQKRMDDLERQLTARNEIIAKLQKQQNDLERRLNAFGAPSPAASQTATGKMAATVAQAPAGSGQPQPSAAPVGQPGKTSSGPGSFSVDVEAAQRALERNLTQTGALLLPAGQIDFEPSLTYARRETSSYPLIYNLGGSNALVPQQVKRDETTGNLALKVGLPWDSQLEFGLPYSFVHQSLLTDFGPAGRFTGSANASGLGDLSVGVAKTLARERGWRPDLIGRFTYIVGNGDRVNNGVALPAGNPAAQVQLVALKRQDPLAFVGSLSYQKAFEKDQIRQGDQIGFSVGTVLAASPQTSLQFSFSQTFVQKLQINGSKVPGSEQTVGMFNVGASSILSKNVMFNTVLSMGLSNDAPKYAIQFTLPIRFNY
ncbi:transporter [Sulfuriferula sp. GW1]|uniref:transporter n=1 Tax=Sulfuriferula sp. GW1 TaxID=3345111 RepID=UPI0039B0948E